LPIQSNLFMLNPELESIVRFAPTEIKIDLFDPSYESISQVIYQQYSDLIRDGPEWRKIP
jgi:CO dehydrogenase/acetyl-CoA synthase delta subunit